MQKNYLQIIVLYEILVSGTKKNRHLPKNKRVSS